MTESLHYWICVSVPDTKKHHAHQHLQWQLGDDSGAIKERVLEDADTL
jgi:hypothetical protein